MSHSDNNKGEIDILDFLTNKIDELLCQAESTKRIIKSWNNMRHKR